MNTRILLGVLLFALPTMGSDCINDGFLVSVNIEGITGRFDIRPGNDPTFGPPNDCETIAAKTYLTDDFGEYENVRVYDITVQTIGTYAGDVNGSVLVNGRAAASYNGPWSAFNKPQSLLTSGLVTRSGTGVGELVLSVLSRRDITICGQGSVTQVPVPSGLSVIIEVLGQVDANP
ncbi:MAG: hypothetical protein OEM41_01485 [Ignavibacteria bacterium]|nr:hypothetical protein [Ignavibacteria bacterium]